MIRTIFGLDLTRNSYCARNDNLAFEKQEIDSNWILFHDARARKGIAY